MLPRRVFRYTWRDSTLLKFRIASLEQQLSNKNEDYEVLEQKYLEQREQRLRDKAIVDHAYEEVQAMETLCEGVIDAYEMLKDLLDKKDQEHQAVIEKKD
jgi:hypothetical protein